MESPTPTPKKEKGRRGRNHLKEGQQEVSDTAIKEEDESDSLEIKALNNIREKVKMRGVKKEESLRSLKQEYLSPSGSGLQMDPPPSTPVSRKRSHSVFQSPTTGLALRPSPSPTLRASTEDSIQAHIEASAEASTTEASTEAPPEVAAEATVEAPPPRGLRNRKGTVKKQGKK